MAEVTYCPKHEIPFTELKLDQKSLYFKKVLPVCIVTLSCFKLETRNSKQGWAEGCPKQKVQVSICCKPGCNSLFQLWQPMTWSGRHLACSVHLLKSPWLGPTRVTRRGSSQPSQRATTGLQNTMKPFICKCEKYPEDLVWQVQMQRVCPQIPVSPASLLRAKRSNQ